MKRSVIIITILAVLSLAALVASCRKSEAGTAAAAQKVVPVNIQVEPVQPMRLVDAIQVAGVVKAYEDVTIAPEEGGVVKKWVVEKGRPVRKGGLIVQINDEVIKAGYDAAQAQYNLAQLNYEKQQKVFEQQGISELQFKTLEFNRDAAKANADLMKARWERTQIKSPVDGVLEYNYVDAGAFAAPGMPLARVVNNTRVKVQAEIPERSSGTIPSGTSAIITVDASPGDTLRGTVGYVGTTVSAANRTLLVEIVVPNPGAKLKPEMVAKVRLVRQTKNDAIMVNESLVQLADRDRYVLYVEHDGKAEERRVRMGGRQGNMVEIVDGLKAGDRLITVGYQKLVQGQPVVVTQ
jgi:membrane fusion protein (multidrug efflux system)